MKCFMPGMRSDLLRCWASKYGRQGLTSFLTLIILVITSTASAEYTLEGEIINREGFGGGVPPVQLTFTFPADRNTLIEHPWVVADQYIKIRYGSHETYWAVKIITKNEEVCGVNTIAPKPIGIGPGPDGVPGNGDDTWRAGPDGIYNGYPAGSGNVSTDDVWGFGPDRVAGTADDTVIVTFAGLINMSFKNNPEYRAPLAWQVFKVVQDAERNSYNADISSSIWDSNNEYIIPAGKFFSNPGPINDDTVTGGLYNHWAYIADVKDTGYVNDSEHEYFLAAYGSSIFALLAQHPILFWETDGNGDGIPDDNNGDGYPDSFPKPGGFSLVHEMVIYVGANFGLRNASGQYIGILPTGNYRSRIYIELIHFD